MTGRRLLLSNIIHFEYATSKIITNTYVSKYVRKPEIIYQQKYTKADELHDPS